ncbi:MAG: hypothetical protein IH991_16500 [Planctomycetes bacterium]|nr:hypothetical protein [Planctomycetota bacterium]
MSLYLTKVRYIKLVARGEGPGKPNSVPPPSRFGQFHRRGHGQTQFAGGRCDLREFRTPTTAVGVSLRRELAGVPFPTVIVDATDCNSSRAKLLSVFRPDADFDSEMGRPEYFICCAENNSAKTVVCFDVPNSTSFADGIRVGVGATVSELRRFRLPRECWTVFASVQQKDGCRQNEELEALSLPALDDDRR